MNYFIRIIQIVSLLVLEGGNIRAGRILVIHAIYSGSPVLTWRTTGEYFAQHGHQIHYLRWKDTHHHSPLPHSNMTETVLTVDNEDGKFPFLTKEKAAGFDIPFDLLLSEGLSYTRMYYEAMKAYPLFETVCDQLLGNKELIHQFRQMNFQLAIVDLVGNECSLALVHHLGLPIVGFWGMQFASAETTLTTAFIPPSHAPNLLTKFGSEMTFSQRLINLAAYVASNAVVRGHCWLLSGLVQKHLPGSPDPCSLLKELNGMLINSDHIMDTPQLLPPTFVRVGGMHIKKTKPLPEDLEEWMQSSGDDGVVLFAVGYTINPKILSKKFIQAFFKAARRLPQKFLMKLEGPFEDVPPNVRIMSWIPQQDVLGSNYTRLFVSHCGLQGVTEALYHAVPMVGMPIFFDQGDYLVKLVKHGVAVPLDRETASADSIYQTLSRVLKNPDFKHNAKKLSKLIRDSPQTPQKKALELVEYLIRHKGAPHLKIASRHLNFFQYFCIDIAVFLIVLLVMGYYFLKNLAKMIWRANTKLMSLLVYISYKDIYAENARLSNKKVS